MTTEHFASYLEINTSHLVSNIKVIKDVLKNKNENNRTSLGVVLKANAYGHGLEPVFLAVHELVDMVFLISARDALRLRQLESECALPPKRILVMGATSLAEAIELSQQGIEVTVGDRSWEKAVDLLRGGLRIRVHIHVDTGLSREGFVPAELATHLSFLKRYKNFFEVVGVFSHFANTEDVTEQSYALEQLEAFERGVEEIEKNFAPQNQMERHFAASAATLVLPQSRFDVARVGISLYGFWPSPESRLSAKIVLHEVPLLKPVLSWRVPSQIVKTLPAGCYVGYGCSYRCTQPTRIAVLPVGYFDGYPRLLSSRSHVLVKGKRCPVLGRVMMNHIVVDVTGATDSEEPVLATLLGQDGNEVVTAEMLAGWAQTIHYEIVARLGEHLERRCVE